MPETEPFRSEPVDIRRRIGQLASERPDRIGTHVVDCDDEEIEFLGRFQVGNGVAAQENSQQNCETTFHGRDLLGSTGSPIIRARRPSR